LKIGEERSALRRNKKWNGPVKVKAKPFFPKILEKKSVLRISNKWKDESERNNFSNFCKNSRKKFGAARGKKKWNDQNGRKTYSFFRILSTKIGTRGNKNLNGKSERKPFYRKFAKKIRRCSTTTHGAVKTI